ncbi:hypothetical protein N7541_002494 [Penicillium brevicompactum]|uniref:Succinate dehydrogenase [ubiquinone] cytochrome b small subunit n=1 Tax=Penicillium brevicompactum TaxID=5074 RepID=A0A9W9RLB3_PENBR|nr:uncharacterized protein N7506_006469 [Penicillium brevicompactum]KAJ5332686.1 hypothetical protein N7506_006469 [Penicillium brevicompactum]KAJ5351694.1 hypothetical protein N7452_000668 [Penicillium brevicompactum]KAJ5361650.1 hypothetical protein N7541_002494 [Penicillium brevicompactum]
MASFARSSLLRQTLAVPRAPFCQKNVGVSQMVAFHASAKKQILPPLPQSVEGTMNDPAPVPETHPSHGSYHWSFERLVSVGLVPLTIAPFAAGSLNPVMDAVLCSLIVAHSHIGFQAAIVDYFPPSRVPKFRSLCNWLLRAFTLTTAVGLYEFETNDVGITEALRRLWTA